MVCISDRPSILSSAGSTYHVSGLARCTARPGLAVKSTRGHGVGFSRRGVRKSELCNMSGEGAYDVRAKVFSMAVK